MMLVHEVIFDRQEQKVVTIVRVTAGAHVAETDPQSGCIFQQPLHIDVEQGTQSIVIDLLDANRRVMATTTLDIAKDILEDTSCQQEKVYLMKRKAGNNILNP